MFFTKEMSHKKLKFKLLSAVIALFCLSSCSHVYSEVSLESAIQSSTPKVTSYPNFKNISAKAKTLAFVAPDRCLDTNLRSKSGAATELVGSNCGDAMGIAEKLIAGVGYEVVSWKLLSNKGSKSTIEIARDLEIDMLLSVNSINAIPLTKNSRVERSYFKSDTSGGKGDPWDIKESIKDQIVPALRTLEKSYFEKTIAFEIDVTATDVRSGKTIWNFEGVAIDQGALKASFSAVFKKSGKSWNLYMIDGKKVDSRSRAVSSNVELSREDVLTDVNKNLLQHSLKKMIDAFETSKNQ